MRCHRERVDEIRRKWVFATGAAAKSVLRTDAAAFLSIAAAVMTGTSEIP